jgi:hypothetical protein
MTRRGYFAFHTLFRWKISLKHARKTYRLRAFYNKNIMKPELFRWSHNTQQSRAIWLRQSRLDRVWLLP